MQSWQVIGWLVRPAHEGVQVVLLFMALYFVYSIVVLRLSPSVSTDEDGVDQVPGVERWESSYVSKILEQIRLIANLHHSDWKAILDTNRAAILYSVDRFRRVANVLLLLGLVATILGLAQTVSEMPSIAANRIAESELKSSLRQLGSAFSGTFWGVMGAIVFNIFYFRRRNYVQRQLDKHDLSILTVLKNILPPSPGAYLKDLQNVAEQTKVVVNELKTIVGNFGPTMDSASKNFNDALSKSGHVIQEAIKGLEKEAQDIQVSLKNAASDLNQAVASVGEVTEAITVAVSKLANAHKELLSQVQEQFSLWKKHLEQVVNSTNSLKEEFHNKILETISQLNFLNNAVRDNIIKVGELNDQFAKAKIEFASLLQKHYQDASEGVKGALEKTQEHMKQLERAFLALQTSSDEILARIELTTSEIMETTRQVTSAAEHSRDRLKESATYLASAFETISQMSPKVEKAFHATDSRLTEARAKLEEAISDFTSAVNKLTEVVSKHPIQNLSRERTVKYRGSVRRGGDGYHLPDRRRLSLRSRASSDDRQES